MSDIQAITKVNTINNSSLSTSKAKGKSSNFSSFLGETESLDTIFEEASKKYKVPVNLLKAIGKAESDFNPSAVSRSGAVGVMQLMPKTAQYLGVTDSYDARQNIMGGTKYIKELLDKYDGDTSLALAAYNAGMNNVKKYNGIPPFKETQNYVKKVHEFMKSNAPTGVTTNVKVNSSKAATPYTPLTVQRTFKSPVEEVSSTVVDDLEEIFNYDKYLKFLELFMKENDKAEKEEEKKDNSLVASAINYNIPVLNLLKSI